MKSMFQAMSQVYEDAFQLLKAGDSASVEKGFSLLRAEVEARPADRPRLFVQLGSTLRNLKQFTRSREVLFQGLREFPDFQALKAFLALTEYSSGDHAKALQLLFEVTLSNRTDSSITEYRRALSEYSKNISNFP